MRAPPPKGTTSSSVPPKGDNIQNKTLENLECDKGKVLLLWGSWGEEEVNLLLGKENQPNLDALEQ